MLSWDTFRKLINIRKIDSLAVKGLLGVEGSLAYKVHEIEKHFHGSEYWYGNGGSLDLSRTTANFFTLGAGSTFAYGTEVQIHDGGALISGWVKIDIRKVLVKGVSASNKLYTIQLWNGTGAFGAAAFMTEDEFYFPATSKSDPIVIMTPRIAVTDKIWARIRCETNSASLDIRFGVHGYVG